MLVSAIDTLNVISRVNSFIIIDYSKDNKVIYYFFQFVSSINQYYNLWNFQFYYLKFVFLSMINKFFIEKVNLG